MFAAIILAFVICGHSHAVHQINDAGVQLIKNFEGFNAEFQNTTSGIQIIGYGHACHTHDCERISPPISEEEATELLHRDLQPFEECVDRAMPNLDEDKFAALVSFAFDQGCGALEDSELARRVRDGRFRAASRRFIMWTQSSGIVRWNLIRRRVAERKLFCRLGGC